MVQVSGASARRLRRVESSATLPASAHRPPSSRPPNSRPPPSAVRVIIVSARRVTSSPTVVVRHRPVAAVLRRPASVRSVCRDSCATASSAASWSRSRCSARRPRARGTSSSGGRSSSSNTDRSPSMTCVVTPSRARGDVERQRVEAHVGEGPGHGHAEPVEDREHPVVRGDRELLDAGPVVRLTTVPSAARRSRPDADRRQRPGPFDPRRPRSQGSTLQPITAAAHSPAGRIGSRRRTAKAGRRARLRPDAVRRMGARRPINSRSTRTDRDMSAPIPSWPSSASEHGAISDAHGDQRRVVTVLIVEPLVDRRRVRFLTPEGALAVGFVGFVCRALAGTGTCHSGLARSFRAQQQ